MVTVDRNYICAIDALSPSASSTWYRQGILTYQVTDQTEGDEEFKRLLATSLAAAALVGVGGIAFASQAGATKEPIDTVIGPWTVGNPADCLIYGEYGNIYGGAFSNLKISNIYPVTSCGGWVQVTAVQNGNFVNGNFETVPANGNWYDSIKTLSSVFGSTADIGSNPSGGSETIWTVF